MLATLSSERKLSILLHLMLALSKLSVSNLCAKRLSAAYAITVFVIIVLFLQFLKGFSLVYFAS